MQSSDDAAIVVLSSGDVSALERGYAREKVRRVLSVLPEVAQFVHVLLEIDDGCRRAIASAELDVSDRLVRARSSADNVFAAVNGLEKRILDGFAEGIAP